MNTTRLARLRERLSTPWALVALLLFSFGLILLRSGGSSEQFIDPSKAFPHSYMVDVDIREFDPQGQLQYHLQTPLITQFQVGSEPSAEDYTLLNLPQLHFNNNADEAPWDASANLGRSSGGQLLLQDNVVLQQQSPSQGLLRLETSELRVRPSEQYAETDKAVKMRSAKGQVDALGMQAHLLESRVQLQSDVRAVYEPR